MPSAVFTPEQIAKIKAIVREILPEIIQAVAAATDEALAASLKGLRASGDEQRHDIAAGRTANEL